MNDRDVYRIFGGALRAGQAVWIQPAIEIMLPRRRWFARLMRRVWGV